MKALILSAGQGRRLLPLTTSTPKCMLRIHGQSLLEWQLDELTKCGVDEVTVVVGYGADQIKRLLNSNYNTRHVRTLYNPDFAVADNLVSCWTARGEMNEDFILLNGDTLFEAAVLEQLLDSPAKPVTVTTNHKLHYDADDMKVILDGKRLVKIGKALDDVDGESIGMISFRGEGPALFQRAIEDALKNPAAKKQWYLSVIDKMARTMPIWTCSIEGLLWCEVDCPADLKQAKKVVSEFAFEENQAVVAGSNVRYNVG